MTKKYLVIILLCFLSNSCQQDNLKEKELLLKEKELQIKEKELNDKQKTSEKKIAVSSTNIQNPEINSNSNSTVSTKKFALIIYHCKSPKLVTYGTTNPTYYITTENYAMTSKVIEVENFNEEEKYKMLDSGSKEANDILSTVLQNLYGEIVRDVRPYEKGEELYREAKEKAKIYDREVRIFETYKEASIAKQNI